jgi:prolyl oligopeptidase
MRSLVSLLCLAMCPISIQAQSLPTFPAKNVPETFFGVMVDDPYRALEDEKDPTVAAWMKAQADYAHTTLENLKGYAALRQRIAELDNATPVRISQVRRTKDGSIFFTRRGANENTFKLYVRGPDGKERVLVDPDDWEKKTGKPHAINYFEPSPDSAIVAVGISPDGTELASLHLIETATRKQIGDPIERARYSTPQWLPDSKAFFYTRIPLLAPGTPSNEIFRNGRAYLHVAGNSAAEDVYVLGPASNSKVPVLPTDTPNIFVAPGSRHAVAVVRSGTQSELALYSAPLATIGKADTPWVRICEPADKVTDFDVRGDDIYLLTHQASPRFSIMRTKLAAPNFHNAEIVVKPGPFVITMVAGARDALYFVMRDGALKRLMRMHWDTKDVSEVRFPVEGAANIISSSMDVDGALVGVAGWTRALEIYAVAADGKVSNTGLQLLGAFDAPTDLVATEVKVRSHDGAMVPLSIIHKNGIELDGGNPAILIAYGSYGVTYDASFNSVRLAWLENGGIYAVANVRGSSAYGYNWYRDGYKATKPNTWKDLIACAEYLIDRKYTARARLGLLGDSAGGIAVGRALTERPDLFAAVVPIVGMLDMVRLEVMPIGPVNVVEFGDVKNEDEFRGLLAMSSYHHVKEGVGYPAVLLQHGVNDMRVNVGQSNKMAARLMAATTSGKPVLLDLEYEGGHGQGATKAQRNRQIADQYAFILWQAGHPEFQPRRP